MGQPKKLVLDPFLNFLQIMKKKNKSVLKKNFREKGDKKK
jgi:hypothetical protein